MQNSQTRIPTNFRAEAITHAASGGDAQRWRVRNANCRLGIVSVSTRASLCLAMAALAWPAGLLAAELKVTAVNRLALARASQTIELSPAQLAPMGVRDLNTLHVQDASGRAVMCQVVDTDGDAYRRPDQLIFQADFAPNQTNTFTITVGRKQVFTREQFRAFGRFVRERFDDFAWENDRIAHRTYGRGLETWDGEPLTSSTFDVWSKRTPRMVINDWYLADDYHTDRGEGADFYSAGLSRGGGANGLWAAERLWVSRNFVNSRVLANGPIRVLFELEYAPFEVNGISVSEVKRITLDGGQQLGQFQSIYRQYTRPGQTQPLTMGVGLKKVSGEQLQFNGAQGWLAKWEAVEKNAGQQGLAIIVDSQTQPSQAEDRLNHLLLLPVPADGTARYWAGFCWDRAGLLTNFAAWQRYVADFAQGARSPIEITVSSAP